MDNQLENIGKKANEMKIQEKWNENRRKIEEIFVLYIQGNERKLRKMKKHEEKWMKAKETWRKMKGNERKMTKMKKNEETWIEMKETWKENKENEQTWNEINRKRKETQGKWRKMKENEQRWEENEEK